MRDKRLSKSLVKSVRKHFAKIKLQHSYYMLNNAIDCLSEIAKYDDREFEEILNDLYPAEEFGNGKKKKETKT